ncbi:urea transporter [Albibacterium bauzanense]|uniref:Urea transporter n=1 Tax=Albibacterium bauzanense TaxID=653929 RepID=A0A4R1LY60_9SPHI|nr:urea transporter [Albibacterium bauzanense]TCK83484.1 urea transporter [Albibacterium bauzanense]
MRNYVLVILRGMGQVMFQNNALSGLLFLAGIFYNSWLLALAVVLGTVISTATAQLLKYSQSEIDDGIYGFNGALVGVAIWFFFGFSIITTAVLIAGAALSTLLMYGMKKFVPPFTAPFVLVTWLMILLLLFVLQVPLVAPPISESNSFDLLSTLSKGFSQVWFQDNIVTGIFFLLALAVNSRTSAIYALYGSALGALIAMLLSQPISMINAGLFGYNAVLCAIALGDKKLSSFLWATLAIALSVILNLGIGSLGFITLTSAFVLATWVVLYIQRLFPKAQ